MGAQLSQERVNESRIYNSRQCERGQDGVLTRVGPLCLCSAEQLIAEVAVSSQLTVCWDCPNAVNRTAKSLFCFAERAGGCSRARSAAAGLSLDVWGTLLESLYQPRWTLAMS